MALPLDFLFDDDGVGDLKKLEKLVLIDDLRGDFFDVTTPDISSHFILHDLENVFLPRAFNVFSSAVTSFSSCCWVILVSLDGLLASLLPFNMLSLGRAL